MRALLQPGGTLAVLGLCRSRYPADLPREAIAAIAIRAYRLTRSYCELQAPTVWPPPEDYAGMQRLARRELPGARFRRLVLWRYSPVWVKPG